MNELDLVVGKQTLTVFVQEQDGEQWVAVKPLCDALGLASWRQKQRLESNPQFKVATYVAPSDSGMQEMISIPVKQIGMWICTINANKVKPEVKQALLDFQMHLQVVIHDALTGRVTAGVIEKLEKIIAYLVARVEAQDERIKYLEAGASRFEVAETKAAASRMAHKRWADKDRDQLH